MDTQSGLQPAEHKVDHVPTLISPQFDGRTGPTVDRRSISDWSLSAVDAEGDVGTEDDGEGLVDAERGEAQVPAISVEAMDEVAGMAASIDEVGSVPEGTGDVAHRG